MSLLLNLRGIAVLQYLGFVNLLAFETAMVSGFGGGGKEGFLAGRAVFRVAWRKPAWHLSPTMPIKGFFTQGVAILLSRKVRLAEIEPLLKGFTIVGHQPAAEPVYISGPEVIVAYRPEANGCLIIDVQDSPWPDDMGDPQKARDLFAAWSIGAYGPFAYPGSLARATQQSWLWPEAAKLPAHKAFLRIRISYLLGAGGDQPVFPKDYEPLSELVFITNIAVALLKHPAALCYFNPNGETLRSRELLRKGLKLMQKFPLPPLDLWSNIRNFDPQNDWWLMDTVGMGQLDLPDCEACFPARTYSLNDVATFLRTINYYLWDKGVTIKDGGTMDGPGEVRWQAHQVKQELLPPPRELFRWYPLDGSSPPAEMAIPKAKSTRRKKPSRKPRKKK